MSKTDKWISDRWKLVFYKQRQEIKLAADVWIDEAGLKMFYDLPDDAKDRIMNETEENIRKVMAEMKEKIVLLTNYN